MLMERLHESAGGGFLRREDPTGPVVEIKGLEPVTAAADDVPAAALAVVNGPPRMPAAELLVDARICAVRHEVLAFSFPKAMVTAVANRRDLASRAPPPQAAFMR